MTHPSRSAVSGVPFWGLAALILVLMLVLPVSTTPGRLPQVSAQSASVLASTADAMAPDSWAVLNTNGVGCNTLLECAEPGNADNITSDATRGCWDPVLQQFHFTGQDHTNAAPPPRHVVYDAATNSWSQRALPPFGSGRVNHGWNYQACDWRGRAMYRSFFASLQVWKYDFDAQTWTNIGTPPSSVVSYADGFNGYSFNPNFGTKGWLVVTGDESDVNGALYRYDPANSSWARITPNLMPGYPGGAYAWVEYSDVYKMMVFGGGSNTFRRLAQNLTITDAATAPGCTIGNNRTGILHNEPSSGNFVLLCGPSTASWHIYNPVSDTWTTKATPSSITNHILNFPTGGPNWPTWGLIGAPIWDHGVTMYVKCNMSSCGVRLYKGGPVTAGPAPAPPTGVVAK